MSSIAGVPPTATAATTLPAGFTIDPVVSGLNLPTAFDFTNDGRIFIAEKGGVIRVVQNGTLLSTPFIDLSSEINSNSDRGLLGMTLHPNFPSTPYVYVVYTYDPPGLTKDQRGARVARLERIAADPSNTNVASTAAGARTVLLGRNADASVITDPTAVPRLTCWKDGARVEDCIPQDSYRHAIGTVAFGPDGKLYLGNGDSDRLPDGPQEPVNMIGAIMRIDPDTGAGLADNPFYTGDPDDNLSKVWAYGLRNPFRFGFHPTNGQMFIGDVGQNVQEAVHLGLPGKNYGWPCYEGGDRVYPLYDDTETCQELYDEGPRTPLYKYRHISGVGGCVIGGDWYRGTSYPPEYRGAYFLADCTQNWVRYLTPNGSGGYDGHDFASGTLTTAITQLSAGPNSDLHWISIADGTLYRLRYGDAPTFPALRLALPFDDGSGTVASDDSGLGNDGTLRNGAGWGAGRLGGGVTLDGVDDIVSVESSASLTGFGNALTVTAWVRRPASQDRWRAVVSRQLTTDSKDQFFLSFFDGQPRFGINTANGGMLYTGAGTAALGEWVHLAGVYDGSDIELYVNGELRSSSAKAGQIAASSRPILVGGNANGSGAYAASQNLAGNVDEVRLYARALSGAEVRDLANVGQPPDVQITTPAGDIVIDVGTTLDFAATASDPVDGNLTSDIVWSGILHHNTHAHPDWLEPTTGAGGSVPFEDHGDNTYLELCARVTNSAGISDQDCVDVRPTTVTVTVDSMPPGLELSYEDTTETTRFSIVSNVAAVRELSAPTTVGCYTFESWSDGGPATHDIEVPPSDQTYTASYSSSCGANLLRNPGFEAGQRRWRGSGSIVTSKVHSGERAMLISADASRARSVAQRVTVVGGTTYETSGWLSVAKLQGSARILVKWRDASGSGIGTAVVGVLRGTEAWTYRTASLEAPPDATRARFILRVGRERDGRGRAWFDDLSMSAL